MPVVVLP